MISYISKTPISELMLVTPEMAEDMLLRNANNRRLNLAHVAYLRQEIENGAHQVTGDPIKFCPSGTMIDGQHTAHAIVQSGIPTRVFVARGIPKSAQAVMDSGLHRSVADNLTMDGVSNAPIIAAACRSIIMVCCGYNYLKTSTPVIRSVLADFKEEVEFVANAFKDFRPMNVSACIGVMAFFLKANPELKSLITQIASGDNLHDGMPAKTLRKWAISAPLPLTQNYKGPLIEALAFISVTWANGLDCRTVRKSPEAASWFLNENADYVGSIREVMGPMMRARNAVGNRAKARRAKHKTPPEAQLPLSDKPAA